MIQIQKIVYRILNHDFVFNNKAFLKILFWEKHEELWSSGTYLCSIVKVNFKLIWKVKPLLCRIKSVLEHFTWYLYLGNFML